MIIESILASLFMIKAFRSDSQSLSEPPPTPYTYPPRPKRHNRPQIVSQPNPADMCAPRCICGAGRFTCKGHTEDCPELLSHEYASIPSLQTLYNRVHKRPTVFGPGIYDTRPEWLYATPETPDNDPSEDIPPY